MIPGNGNARPAPDPPAPDARKPLWLGMVALPKAASGGLDAVTTEVVVSCSLVVVIMAATPWRYLWRTCVTATGDRWR